MTEPIEFSPLEGEKEFVSKQKRAYKFKRGVKLDSESINVDLNPSPVLQPPSPRRGEGKSVAFTLAEVLITLGIIGVVAALTLPSLIANYQKKQVVTQLKREYTVISNALQSARAEHGDPEEWELGEDNDIQAASDFADTYLLPYLQVIKKCGTSTSGECDYKSFFLNSLTLFDYPKYTRFILNDGAIVLVSTSTGVNTTFPKLIYVTIDINGYKRPNKRGKDVFNFSIALETTNDMYKPTGRLNADGQSQTREKILTDKNGCSKNSNGAFCAALIIKDNWEITKDYPW